MFDTKVKDSYVTVNPCRLCTPLGASLAFRGIRNCMPLIHGSQGCATYIRRFLISHFREPMDIASSSFSEETAIFGGESNLLEAIRNVIKKYNPEVIGIATSCLTETIGDDVNLIINRIKKEVPVTLIPVSTPSFKGSHVIGFHDTVNAVVKTCCLEKGCGSRVFIEPSILSPADLRHITMICNLSGIDPVVLPDYSETLDSGVWNEYTPIPQGGTPVDVIKDAASAESTYIELGSTRENSTGSYLHGKFGTRYCKLDTPIGIEATDLFLKAISYLSGKEIPQVLQKVRNRCIDSYIDAHKYLSGIQAVIFGDEDMVPSIAAFCSEVGIIPVLCASEGKISSEIEMKLSSVKREHCSVIEDADFDYIEGKIGELQPDIMIGTGKGNHISIKYNIPLVRVGFPIHDRIGASRMLLCGYDGAMNLLDSIVNVLLAGKQENIPDGYSYL
ncbi:MAG TPA: nitrogenase component 1 [Chitinispirillaceae bacterium]|nr:nitrogenase component 1 [Chitinispirillaceae bacterium]